ncbi:MAG: NBR1-Ig-like domain-containing protein [Anaerolineales bacterium]
MARKTLLRFVSAGALLSLALSACNLPRETDVPTQAGGALYTSAAQTVSAQLTQAVGGDIDPIRTATPERTPTSSGVPEPTTPVSLTSPTVTEVPCDRATFIKDVNYPDGVDLSPGEAFRKTWRLKNIGSCTWTSGYSLVFDQGDAMKGPASKRLASEDVEPGETVDVSVDLQAPEEAGTYQGFWKLRNPSGQVFGTGEDGSKAFWVKIDVVEGSE